MKRFVFGKSFPDRDPMTRAVRMVSCFLSPPALLFDRVEKIQCSLTYIASTIYISFTRARLALNVFPS